ncbi:PilN domain-containing protein [Massilia orientalis]|uniref:PilN domain-containing protein n=1 Tax=Massilia orientalis TaxID=3050128 RepID=A0ACC7ML06_9BURK|nr:PilN domain-containing protein [Massilia sp. YIM B02787]
MKKVRIDFAPPSLARTWHRAPRGTWSLLFVALGLAPGLGSSITQYRRLQAIEAQRTAQVAQAQAQARAVARTPVAAPARTVPPAQAGAVNASVQQLNLPWRGLHDAVQAATPATIALLALEPDARKSSVRITAEAKNSDDMIAYVEALQRVEWFTTVLLARHEINEQDANRPIRFQIDAQWRSAR